MTEALMTSFRDRVRIVGETAGVHLLAWLPDVSPTALESALERAEEMGIAAYLLIPVT